MHSTCCLHLHSQRPDRTALIKPVENVGRRRVVSRLSRWRCTKKNVSLGEIMFNNFELMSNWIKNCTVWNIEVISKMWNENQFARTSRHDVQQELWNIIILGLSNKIDCGSLPLIQQHFQRCQQFLLRRLRCSSWNKQKTFAYKRLVVVITSYESFVVRYYRIGDMESLLNETKNLWMLFRIVSTCLFLFICSYIGSASSIKNYLMILKGLTPNNLQNKKTWRNLPIYFS